MCVYLSVIVVCRTRRFALPNFAWTDLDLDLDRLFILCLTISSCPPSIAAAPHSPHAPPSRSSLRPRTSITFLKSCETDHSVPEDSIESLQVATQCLSDAFGVDPDSPVDVAKYDLGAGKGLMDVWGVVRGVAKRVGDEDKGSKKDAAPSTAAAADDTKEAPAAASDKKEPTYPTNPKRKPSKQKETP